MANQHFLRLALHQGSKGYFSIDPFMPNVLSHPFQLDESISNFRIVGWYFSFLFKYFSFLFKF